MVLSLCVGRHWELLARQKGQQFQLMQINCRFKLLIVDIIDTVLHQRRFAPHFMTSGMIYSFVDRHVFPCQHCGTTSENTEKQLAFQFSQACVAACVVRIIQSRFAGRFLSFSVASAHRRLLTGCQKEQRGIPHSLSCLVLNKHTRTHTYAHTQKH